MNKIKNIVFTFIAIILVQFTALGEDGLGDFIEPDPMPGPIDSYVWVLFLGGLLYVYSKYKIRNKA
jgi:hypothetical protein